MFGLFKRQTEKEKLGKALEAANHIACDFSDLVGSGCIQPGLIYDVSVLPHPKTVIEKSCKVWISVCPDASQRQAWKVVLPVLAQFQEEIGPTPLGLDVSSIVGLNLSTEELANRIVNMKRPSSQLTAKVHEEENALLRWVMQEIDSPSSCKDES